MHSLYGSETRGSEDDSVQSKHVALISHYMFNITAVVFDGPSPPFNIFSAFLPQSWHLVVGKRTISSEHLFNIVGYYREAVQLAKEIPKVNKLICVTCLAGALSMIK